MNLIVLYGDGDICRGRALTHLGALWSVLFAAFRKHYMGFGTGLRVGAKDRKEERRVYGTWEGQVRNMGLGRGRACYRRQSRYPIAPSEGQRTVIGPYGDRDMRRGRTLTHLVALWRVLSAAFGKQYMGLDRA